MAKKNEPIVNKMYVWELEVDGEIVEWKCFVGEDECILLATNKPNSA